MPVAIVFSLVVFLLGLAAMCVAIAVWTVLADRPPPQQMFLPVASPAVFRPPRLAPPNPGRDDDYDDDYTEVDDGVTMIRDLRVAARR